MLKVSHPHELNSIIVARELCPQCQSIYWDGKSCSSCQHYNLDIYVGRPLGTKSFYSLQEQYYDQRGSWRNCWGFFQNSELDYRYKKRLERRFKVLCHQLKKDFSDTSKIYLMELKALSEEYYFLFHDLSDLFLISANYQDSYLFKDIETHLFSIAKRSEKKSNTKRLYPIFVLLFLSGLVFFYRPIWGFFS